MIRGSCLCGAVAIEIAGTPRSLSYCHCSRCRKAEGVFAAVLIGAVDDLRIVRGEDHIRRLEPQEPWTHRRAFCGTCGSALGELYAGATYVVAASLLDDDPGMRPTAHLNVASKPDWYEIADDLKKFEGNYIPA
ncbi:GFA family protein [Sphingomonas oligophenolica]|uniref:GFA family protein n=1 Tax=Sphingomonas oligophenolica TaxID=301154 RepID=A0A502CL04_9SPHN|nr:GFA family protein [Sphingomonas oligophenolica]TPG13598.1 GFA family protein [Sphingomonas oligophenolica]